MDFIKFLETVNLPLERQGPGSINSTLKALSFTGLEAKPGLNVLDAGSGTGAASLVLAEKLQANITSIDLLEAFTKEARRRVKDSKKLKSKIEFITGSMDQLEIEEQSLDLIWSEGAIYNIGFENGINYFKKFLKPSGFLAVSEITWLTSDRPQEIHDFWAEAYPEIGLASEKIKILESQGYKILGYFPLSRDEWMDGYYTPLKSQVEKIIPNESTAPMISEQLKEIELYEKYGEYYSYGFYIAESI